MLFRVHRTIYTKFCATLKQLTKSVSREMTSNSKSDHLERTAENTREDILSQATVIGMKNESPTVKSLTLQIHDKRLYFKAGQWVDLFIPELEKVGGFSMCSSPLQLQEKGTIDLAVKYSTHPPAHWVHTKCSVGTDVQARVGGDVFYEKKDDSLDQNLLLIAGGIGINPLYSILCHVTNLKQRLQNCTSLSRKVYMLYSASSSDELIFKENITRICKENEENVRCQFFITRDKSSSANQNEKSGRISSEDVKEALRFVQQDNLLTFICGPGGMISDMEKLLIENNVSKEHVQYEKWW